MSISCRPVFYICGGPGLGGLGAKGLLLGLDNCLPIKAGWVVELGELSRIIMDLSDIMASGASPSSLKRLKFPESVTIMHFDAHKKFQFHQITLSSSK